MFVRAPQTCPGLPCMEERDYSGDEDSDRSPPGSDVCGDYKWPIATVVRTQPAQYESREARDSDAKAAEHGATESFARLAELLSALRGFKPL